MKKRFLALTLVLLLALSLAACGQKESEIKGSVESGEEPPSVSGSTEAREEPEGSGEESSEAPEEPAESEASAESGDNGDVSIGSIVGGVYTSEFLGIGCTLDSNWTYASEEELAGMSDLSAEAVNDEDLAEMIKNSPSFFDMYAYADEGMTSINIVLENLGVIYGITLDESGYLDIGLENVEQAMASMEIENISIEKTTVEFAGSEHACARITGTYMDVPLYEELICVKQDSYMAVVTMSCYYENILPELEQLFYALES